jgi:hypothetical protein
MRGKEKKGVRERKVKIRYAKVKRNKDNRISIIRDNGISIKR